MRPSVKTASGGASIADAGYPTLLVDLDLQFGEVSTALRLRPIIRAS